MVFITKINLFTARYRLNSLAALPLLSKQNSVPVSAATPDFVFSPFYETVISVQHFRVNWAHAIA